MSHFLHRNANINNFSDSSICVSHCINNAECSINMLQINIIIIISYNMTNTFNEQQQITVWGTPVYKYTQC